MTDSAIRLATLDDATVIKNIYAPYVQETSISFELEVPSVQEFEERISRVLTSHPWLVCERNRRVVGYAYAIPFRAREAYRFSAETTVYVDRNQQRSGIGKSLMLEIISRLKNSGHHRAIAGVTLPNESSVGLHESLGFKPVGVYSQIGFKFENWHDVGFWELDLSADPSA